MAQDIAPPPYDEIRHWKWFARQLLEPLAAAILCITGSVTYADSGVPEMSLLCLLALFPVGVWAYGKWLSWRIRPIRVDPVTGTVEIIQTGYWWLFMKNSSPDVFSLSDVHIVTEQSFVEQVLFKRSETLVIVTGGVDPEKIRSAKDVDEDSGSVFTSVYDASRITEIYRWYKSLDVRRDAKLRKEQRRSNKLLAQLLAGQGRQTDAQEETNRLLRQQQNPDEG